MNNEIQLHHKLITLPAGKKASDFVAERHDIVFLFDCAKSNPNGDPDTGNMPRVQPDSLKGLVTDVCQKRKVRNFFSLYNPDGTLRPDGATSSGYQIFIRENAILKDDLDKTHQIVCDEIMGQLLTELVSTGFLKPDSRGEIADLLDGETYPEKPDGCLDHVLEVCKGKFAYEEFASRVRTELAKGVGFPAESLQALDGFALPDGAKADGEKAEKAIADKCKNVAPRGTKPAVTKALKEVFERLSPAAVLESRFAKISLEEANRGALCKAFFDVRAFGAVVSTKGPLEGSFYGQIRGPIQFTFSESLDKVLQIDATITRCAKASKDEQSGDDAANRTMGRKHGIDYGLYRCHIHFSPAFAGKTAFTYYDLDNFLFALENMFRDDPASGRFLRVVGLVDFQHQSALGNAPAHKLFEKVEVSGVKYTKEEAAALGKPELEGKFKSSDSEFPRAGEAGKIIDYQGSAPGELGKHTPVPGYDAKGITARKIVWEIPDMKTAL